MDSLNTHLKLQRAPCFFFQVVTPYSFVWLLVVQNVGHVCLFVRPVPSVMPGSSQALLALGGE